MMRSKVGFLTSLVIITVAMTVLLNYSWAGTGAVTSGSASPVWPTYHADAMHTGNNSTSTDLTNPATLGLIWVFPRADTALASESDSINDQAIIDSDVWTPDASVDAYGDTANADDEYPFYYAPALPSGSTATGTATWTPSSALTAGYYYIYVWVPTAQSETYSYTETAVYTVYDDTGTTDVTFDQTAGGSWQLLSDTQFTFKSFSNVHKVVLSNVTGDETIDSDIRVAADAIKFVKGSGMEIYGSPVSATINYTWTHDPNWDPAPYNDDDGNYVDVDADEAQAEFGTQSDYDGICPVVYVGSVEKPITIDDDAPNTGAVYCVNSVTPVNTPLANNDNYRELSEELGTAIWRYPARIGDKSSYDHSATRNRDPLEGPIQGGIYASPTLATLSDGTKVCYVAGQDRQVYALNAETGRLIWKGPGMTVSESGAVVGGDPASVWVNASGLDEAFGGNMAYTTNSSAIPMRWDFGTHRENTRYNEGNINGEGWAYSVYVWIPPATSESITRGTGTYTITSENDPVSVKVDQSDVSNQGRWVQIGNSYFNVKQVSLEKSYSDTTMIVADAVMIVPNTIGSFGYSSPVVDVTKKIGDTSVSGTATKVFAVTETGRALCFNAAGTTPAAGITSDEALCMVNWIYPRIRNTKSVTGSDTADADPMDSVGATPAYWANGTTPLLFLADINSDDDIGHVYCIDVTTGKEKWNYYDDTAGTDEYGGKIGLGGFTCSPTVDDAVVGKEQIFIGSTSGYFYCLNANAAKDASYKQILNWRYPEKNTSTPLGAFRYSTPVVGDAYASDGAASNSIHRVWVGSDEGLIYSFDARPGTTTDPDDRRLYVSYGTDSSDSNTTYRYPHPAGIYYFESDAYSALRGAIAVDAAESVTEYVSSYNFSGGSKDTENSQDHKVYNSKTMYAGDMAGVLHWYSADSGRSDWYDQKDEDDEDEDNTKGQNYNSYQFEGELFASPNITNFDYKSGNNISYVYVASTAGWVGAFSDDDGAWGGTWAGGLYPFDGIADGSRYVTNLASDTDLQFDIFKKSFYDGSKGKSAETSLASNPNYYTPYDTTYGIDWDNFTSNPWSVSPEMKLLDTSGITRPVDPADPNYSALCDTFDDLLNDKLLEEAYDQRKYAFDLTSRRGSDTPVYYEWGESIYVALWNLPSKAYLSSVRITAGKGTRDSSVSNTKKYYKVLDDPDGNNPTSAPVLTWGAGGTVERGYAYGKYDIKYNNSPTPGTGWVVKADISFYKTSAKKSVTRTTIPISKLRGGSPYKPFVADGTYQRQIIGINNPLAIKDDRNYDNEGTSVSLAWPNTSAVVNNCFATVGSQWAHNGYSRDEPEAHYNGNAYVDSDGNYNLEKKPTINLGLANHGAITRQARLWVMDRSAVGVTTTSSSRTKKLEKFRVTAGELRFNKTPTDTTGESTIAASGGVKFPWEFGIGSSDYPSIYKQRQDYVKASDGGDPSNDSTKLPALYDYGSTGEYDNAANPSILVPDSIFVSVDVPRFQPANYASFQETISNITTDKRTGYSRGMKAYIDSDGKNGWTSANETSGGTKKEEAYRRFYMGVRVPPDPKIEVEERLIDVGKAPHGLGEGLNEFSAYNPSDEVSQWFKKVTIRNAGNVNLPRMYIGRTTPMFSDQAGSNSPLPGGSITSSLDYYDPIFQRAKNEPFVTVYNGTNYGYTLTKARVGDPDPTELTIPDQRKWDMDYNYTKASTNAAIDDLNTTFGSNVADDEPLPVKVGVRVPLTQPVGTYYSYDNYYGVPYVSVFCDTWVQDGLLNSGNEPYAETSFQLKVSVRENQLTGGVTPYTLPQIDIPQTEDANGNGLLDDGEDNGSLGTTGQLDDFTPRVGDATPAAFKVPASGSASSGGANANEGNVYLFWSSNRLLDSTAQNSYYPDWATPSDARYTSFANAPWFIDRATLTWDDGWQTVGANASKQWWETLSPTIPSLSDQWPTTTGLMEWQPGYYSVRHHSPVIAQTLSTTQSAPTENAWLAWVGVADKQDSTSEKVTQEHLIFYTNVTGGTVAGTSSHINQDPGMVKRSPSLSVYDGRMWMFWQGGDKGNWSIKYSTNDTTGFPSDGWAAESTLMVPSCLTSVSSPNCILRRFWGSLSGSSGPNYINDATGRELLDIVYAGTTKYNKSSDILLGRYAAVSTTDATTTALQDAMPSVIAQPLPRVFNQELKRDSQYGYYTSQHLAWIKPDTENPVTDSWGRAKYLEYLQYLSDNNSTAVPDVPYIRVYLPEGYKLPDGTELSEERAISATDGSVWSIDSDGVDNSEITPGTAITPTYDDATGIYTYDYPNGSAAQSVLGEMLVDYSAGIVRFNKSLNEVKELDSNGKFVKFISPQVRADYTPRTWRITTDAAVDNSPRAFIERTNMNTTANPGMGNFAGDADNAPVDRLWVFWRKAGTGVNTSTIYYKTYRVGIDLAALGHKPIPMITDYSKYATMGKIPGNVDSDANLSVSSTALGPWEVNRAGTKIYFSEVDERYMSLLKSGSKDVLGNGPSAITITYRPTGASADVTVTARDIYWIEEIPEQSLLGFSADGNVNEGSIYAFADPDPEYYKINNYLTGDGTYAALLSSKIWVFWTSTRGGTSDLFWETLSPNFAAN
ncbi:MAG: hypothetical protein ABFD49_07930 [Armatimonadota bacterium]|nr:hypothetical protein [bacterium]